MNNHTKKKLVYKISYKTLVDAKPLRIGFIRVYDGTRYLILFGSEEYNVIYHRIRYLIIQKSGITFLFFVIMEESKLIHLILFL